MNMELVKLVKINKKIVSVDLPNTVSPQDVQRIYRGLRTELGEILLRETFPLESARRLIQAVLEEAEGSEATFDFAYCVQERLSFLLDKVLREAQELQSLRCKFPRALKKIARDLDATLPSFFKNLYISVGIFNPPSYVDLENHLSYLKGTSVLGAENQAFTPPFYKQVFLGRDFLLRKEEPPYCKLLHEAFHLNAPVLPMDLFEEGIAEYLKWKFLMQMEKKETPILEPVGIYVQRKYREKPELARLLYKSALGFINLLVPQFEEGLILSGKLTGDLGKLRDRMGFGPFSLLEYLDLNGFYDHPHAIPFLARTILLRKDDLKNLSLEKIQIIASELQVWIKKIEEALLLGGDQFYTVLGQFEASLFTKG